MKNGIEFDVEFKDGRAVLKAEHEGSDGGVKIEGYVKADKLIGKALDELERIIPGDQKPMVAAAKAALAALKF